MVNGQMGTLINLARVCIPYPADDAFDEPIPGICRKTLNGVLYELMGASPNFDDMPTYAEFYQILEGVYNISCSGPLPQKKPYTKWHSLGMSCQKLMAQYKAEDRRRLFETSNVLICHTATDQKFLAHLYLNFVRRSNGQALIDWPGKVPSRFNTTLKNDKVKQLIQKWAVPSRFKVK